MAQEGNLSSWAGEIFPQSPVFEYPASPERVALVEKAIHSGFSGITVREVRMLRDYPAQSLYDGSLQGIYAANISPHETLPEDVIVHIKPKSNEGVMRIGAGVFDHLRMNGVDTTKYYIGHNGNYNQVAGDYSAYFTDLAKGEHPFPHPEVLNIFGQTIGKMRQVFDGLPDGVQSIIKENSVGRYKLWREGIEHFRSKGSQYARENSTTHAVMQFCSDFIGETLPDINDGAAGHFDLIESNVLYSNIDGRTQARILDGDTIMSGLAPRLYDLGTFSFRVGLNTKFPDTDTLPSANAETLEPIRVGFNQTSGQILSKEEYMHAVMQSAALVMMVIPGIEASNPKPPEEISLHAEKMTDKVGRAIHAYKGISL